MTVLVSVNLLTGVLNRYCKADFMPSVAIRKTHSVQISRDDVNHVTQGDIVQFICSPHDDYKVKPKSFLQPIGAA